MPKKMPLRGQLLQKDAMSVDGSNSLLFEELMAAVTEEEQQELREEHAKYMEKQGFSAQAVELMRNPQPFPPPESDGQSTA
jgi:hypothetical protein